MTRPTSAHVQVFGRRDDETDHALKRPATKKRQGTKSRTVGHWLAGSKRYWDCMSAPLSMVGATTAPNDAHVWMQSPGECNGHLGEHAEYINGLSMD
jgi:hypothetical protein